MGLACPRLAGGLIRSSPALPGGTEEVALCCACRSKAWVSQRSELSRGAPCMCAEELGAPVPRGVEIPQAVNAVLTAALTLNADAASMSVAGRGRAGSLPGAVVWCHLGREPVGSTLQAPGPGAGFWVERLVGSPGQGLWPSFSFLCFSCSVGAARTGCWAGGCVGHIAPRPGCWGLHGLRAWR